MGEGIKRVGATTFGVWVIANIILYFSHANTGWLNPLLIFLGGVFVGNVIIAFALVQIQTLLALVFVRELRNPTEHSLNLEQIAKKTERIKNVLWLANVLVTFTIARYAWKIFT
mgnify:CR=1 FL=1